MRKSLNGTPCGMIDDALLRDLNEKVSEATVVEVTVVEVTVVEATVDAARFAIVKRRWLYSRSGFETLIPKYMSGDRWHELEIRPMDCEWWPLA